MNDSPDRQGEIDLARARCATAKSAPMSAVLPRVSPAAAVRDRARARKYAASLAAALGGLKGPLMKVAQLLATIPEALPAEYAAELGQLQVRRRRWVAASCAGAWRPSWTRLGSTLPSFDMRPQPRPRSARCTGPRRTTAGARRQAAVSRHAFRRGGGSDSALILFAIHAA